MTEPRQVEDWRSYEPTDLPSITVVRGQEMLVRVMLVLGVVIWGTVLAFMCVGRVRHACAPEL